MTAVDTLGDLLKFCAAIWTGKISKLGVFYFVDGCGEFAHLVTTVIIPTCRYFCALSSGLGFAFE